MKRVLNIFVLLALAVFFIVFIRFNLNLLKHDFNVDNGNTEIEQKEKPVFQKFSCLINTDGTDFIEFKEHNIAIFTEDSDQLLMQKDDGLYMMDFEGKSKKISNQKYDLSLYSVVPKYFINDMNPKFLSLTDLNGNIALKTDTKQYGEYISYSISNDNEKLFLTYLKNKTYSYHELDLNSFNQKEIFKDSLLHQIIGYDYENNLIYLSSDGKLWTSQQQNQRMLMFKKVYKAMLSKNGEVLLFAKSSSIFSYNLINYQKRTLNAYADKKNNSISVSDLGDIVLFKNHFFLSCYDLKKTIQEDSFLPHQYFYGTLSPDGKKIYACYYKLIKQTN